MSGGKYCNVRRTTDLEPALTDINEVEKGVFYTLSLTRNEAAYFIFVTLVNRTCHSRAVASSWAERGDASPARMRMPV